MLLDSQPSAKRIVYTILLFPLTWMVGLFIFVYHIPEKAPFEIDSQVDAVVILTGGSMRLEEGFNAFIRVQAKKMLISGVGQGVSKSDIITAGAKNTKLQGKIGHNHIILGNIANNTVSNAMEARIFMLMHDFTSMLLVTSNYHIHRSMLVFTNTMPDYKIYPYPVCSDNFRKSGHFISTPSLVLAIHEYNKIIGFYVMQIYENIIAPAF